MLLRWYTEYPQAEETVEKIFTILNLGLKIFAKRSSTFVLKRWNRICIIHTFYYRSLYLFFHKLEGVAYSKLRFVRERRKRRNLNPAFSKKRYYHLASASPEVSNFKTGGIVNDNRIIYLRFSKWLNWQGYEQIYSGDTNKLRVKSMGTYVRFEIRLQTYIVWSCKQIWTCPYKMSHCRMSEHEWVLRIKSEF